MPPGPSCRSWATGERWSATTARAVSATGKSGGLPRTPWTALADTGWLWPPSATPATAGRSGSTRFPRPGRGSCPSCCPTGPRSCRPGAGGHRCCRRHHWRSASPRATGGSWSTWRRHRWPGERSPRMPGGTSLSRPVGPSTPSASPPRMRTPPFRNAGADGWRQGFRTRPRRGDAHRRAGRTATVDGGRRHVRPRRRRPTARSVLSHTVITLDPGPLDVDGCASGRLGALFDSAESTGGRLPGSRRRHPDDTPAGEELEVDDVLAADVVGL